MRAAGATAARLMVNREWTNNDDLAFAVTKEMSSRKKSGSFFVSCLPACPRSVDTMLNVWFPPPQLPQRVDSCHWHGAIVGQKQPVAPCLHFMQRIPAKAPMGGKA
jgi:hypothetical protein